MDVFDVEDRLSELTRAAAGLGGLLYGQDPIPASGGELAALVGLLEREVKEVSEVIAALRLASMA